MFESSLPEQGREIQRIMTSTSDTYIEEFEAHVAEAAGVQPAGPTNCGTADRGRLHAVLYANILRSQLLSVLPLLILVLLFGAQPLQAISSTSGTPAQVSRLEAHSLAASRSATTSAGLTADQPALRASETQELLADNYEQSTGGGQYGSEANPEYDPEDEELYGIDEPFDGDAPFDSDVYYQEQYEEARVTTSTMHLPDDASNVTPRSVGIDVGEMRARAVYAYHHELPAEPSLWEQFKSWFWDLLLSPVDDEGEMTLLELLGYFLILGSIIVIVRILMGGAFFGIFGRRDQVATIEFQPGEEEDIEDMSLEKLLAAAMAERHFRAAVRLRFLLVLRELARRDIIIWKRDKTNSDYLREIQDPVLKKLFRASARWYEQVWYGEWNIGAGEEERIAEVFNKLLSQIGSREVIQQ